MNYPAAKKRGIRPAMTETNSYALETGYESLEPGENQVSHYVLFASDDCNRNPGGGIFIRAAFT